MLCIYGNITIASYFSIFMMFCMLDHCVLLQGEAGSGCDLPDTELVIICIHTHTLLPSNHDDSCDDRNEYDGQMK